MPFVRRLNAGGGHSYTRNGRKVISMRHPCFLIVGFLFFQSVQNAYGMQQSTSESGPDDTNGETQGVRDCEGQDLKGQTCRSLGFTGGVLRCNEQYEFDFSGCTKCGNKIVEPGEDCEPSRPLTASCEQAGFPGGTLGCRTDCTFDVSACNRWIRLEAGRRHACAQSADGQLWCWGDNTAGQLGTAQASPPGPAPVARLGTDVTMFAAGLEHTCAVRANGSVWCWGSNTVDGRLGDGTTAPRKGPVRVSGLDGDVVTMAAGETHTCVLKKDRTVWCWGGNSFGQLGDGTRKDRFVPVRVDAVGGGVRLLAVGSRHSCALKSDDSLWCWGDNAAGQLGETPSLSRPAPQKVAGLRTQQAVAMAAGDKHVCLLYRDGRAVCWGGMDSVDQDAQDSTGKGSDRLPLLQLASPEGRWVHLGLGKAHGCGRTADGNAHCWGNGLLGQLGYGQSAVSSTPVAVNLPSRRVADVKVGDNFACALLTDGSISCWGDNSCGQLGIPFIARREKPVFALSNAVFDRIFAGFDRTCALDRDKNAWCWGDNAFGQLGDRTTTARAIPVKLGDYQVIHMALGERHSCFVSISGKIFCMGDNREGQAGLGPDVPISKTPQRVEIEDPALSLCAGSAHTCARMQDGRVRCWGRNDEGQLGLGDTRHRGAPTIVELEKSASHLACGDAHSCIIDSDGGVWCWGDNAFGQLGDGSRNRRLSPVRAAMPEKASMLSAAGRQTCLRGERGQAYCWGFNFYGQLGDGTTEDRAAPARLALAANLVLGSLAAGATHGCLVRSDNHTAACWGKNDQGQLGDGTLTLRKTPTMVGFPAGTPVPRSIAAGTAHSCALLENGRIACWGNARQGQLGDGTISHFPTPRPLVVPASP